MPATRWSLGCYRRTNGVLVVAAMHLMVQVQGGDVVSIQVLGTAGLPQTYNATCPPNSFISSWATGAINWAASNGEIRTVGKFLVQCSDGTAVPTFGLTAADGMVIIQTDNGITALIAQTVSSGLDDDTAIPGRLLDYIGPHIQFGPGAMYDYVPALRNSETGVLMCPSGQVLVGLHGTTLAAGISALGMVCGRRPAAGNGSYLDRWASTGVKDPNPGSGRFNASCPPGAFVYQFTPQEVTVNGTTFLSSIKAVCSSGETLGPFNMRHEDQRLIYSQFFPNGLACIIATQVWWEPLVEPIGCCNKLMFSGLSYIERPPVGETVLAEGPGGNFNHTFAMCGISGQVLIGIYGYAWNYLDRLGVICGTVPSLPVAPLDNSTTRSPASVDTNASLTSPTPISTPAVSPTPPPAEERPKLVPQLIAVIVAPIATVVGAAVTIAYTVWKWHHKRKAKKIDTAPQAA